MARKTLIHTPSNGAGFPSAQGGARASTQRAQDALDRVNDGKRAASRGDGVDPSAVAAAWPSDTAGGPDD